MILFLDTETTGLKNPSMLQYAYILCDNSLNCIESGRSYVKPRKKIEEEAIKIHKITKEKAQRLGCTTNSAIKHLSKLISMSDTIVGHNVEFDIDVICNDAKAVKNEELLFNLRTKKLFCTMKESTDLLRIDKGDGSYKFPTLSELYRRLFQHDFANAHDALSDVTATWKCYHELIRINYKRKICEQNIEDIRKKYEGLVSPEMFNEITKQTDQLITYSKNLLTKLSYDTCWIKELLVEETCNFITNGREKTGFQMGFILFEIKKGKKIISISANLTIEESVEFELG
ncbi:MAG: 3'-5' exonuclease [Paludibacteraceae bacterium]|nr:3'-5' exonuclease [Paludibacteraceae bacterium]